jgi:hypothetical protein
MISGWIHFGRTGLCRGHVYRIVTIFRHFYVDSLAATSKVFSANWAEFMDDFGTQTRWNPGAQKGGALIRDAFDDYFALRSPGNGQKRPSA